jgi:hypothetical protein
LTVDEELGVLEEQLRRLKIEYDVFFNGGSKKPPADTEWRVKNLLSKYSDSKMSFGQRFRYNALAQKYATFADIWRKKLRIREEGYQRPADALLSVQGIRTAEEHEAAKALKEHRTSFLIGTSDTERDRKDVLSLFHAVANARHRIGAPDSGGSDFESFKSFIEKKTQQLRKQYGCAAVEYSIETAEGAVRIKAKPKTS